MSLEFILLGMLREESSGYDLRKAFEEGPRHFWSAKLSQIYPALQQMERQGWATSREQASEKGPARRVYRRTPAGKRALHAWLRGEPDIGVERLAYIGQLVFHAELKDPARTLEFLQALRARIDERLEVLQGADEALRSAHAERPIPGWNDDDFHEMLCVRMGVRALQGRLEACDECIALTRARGGIA